VSMILLQIEPLENKIRLQILVEPASIEIFGNDGQVSMSSCFLPNLKYMSLDVYASGGEAKIVFMNIYELCSAM
jgi:fructan beta-fructosidase